MATFSELEYLRRQKARQQANIASGFPTISQGMTDETENEANLWSNFAQQAQSTPKEDPTSSKDSWWQQVFGKTDNLLYGALRGLGKAVEGVVDLGGTIISGVGDMFGADTSEIKSWVQQDIAGELSNSLQTVGVFSPWSWVSNAVNGNYGNADFWNKAGQAFADSFDYTRDSASELKNQYYDYDDEMRTGVGQFASGLAESIGFMAPSIFTGGIAGVGASAQVASLGSMFLSAAGAGAETALNEGATSGQALGYGLSSGIIEVATELATAGILKGLGKGLSSVANKVGLSKVGNVITKLTSTMGNNVNGVPLTKKILGEAARYKLVGSLIEEGSEEVMSDFLAPFAEYLYKGSDAFKDDEGNPLIASSSFWQQVGLSFLSGATIAGIMSGGQAISAKVKYGSDINAFAQALGIVQEMNDEATSKIRKGESITEDKKKIDTKVEEVNRMLGDLYDKAEKDPKTKKRLQKWVVDHVTGVKAEIKEMKASKASALEIAKRYDTRLAEFEAGITEPVNMRFTRNIEKTLKKNGIDLNIKWLSDEELSAQRQRFIEQGKLKSDEALSAFFSADKKTVYFAQSKATEVGKLVRHEVFSHALLDAKPEVRSALIEAIEANPELAKQYEAMEEVLNENGYTEADGYVGDLRTSEKLAHFMETQLTTGTFTTAFESVFNESKGFGKVIQSIKEYFSHFSDGDKLIAQYIKQAMQAFGTQVAEGQPTVKGTLAPAFKKTVVPTDKQDDGKLKAERELTEWLDYLASPTKEVSSEGVVLSKEQAEFFKNSKVRDKDGRLLHVYHGTKNPGFTVFSSRYHAGKDGAKTDGHIHNGAEVNWFTSSLEGAKSYATDPYHINQSDYDEIETELKKGKIADILGEPLEATTSSKFFEASSHYYKDIIEKSSDKLRCEVSKNEQGICTFSIYEKATKNKKEKLVGTLSLEEFIVPSSLDMYSIYLSLVEEMGGPIYGVFGDAEFEKSLPEWEPMFADLNALREMLTNRRMSETEAEGELVSRYWALTIPDYNGKQSTFVGAQGMVEDLSLFHCFSFPVSRLIDETGLVSVHNFELLKDKILLYPTYDEVLEEWKKTHSAHSDPIYEVFLDITNPMVVDAEGAGWNEIKDPNGGRKRLTTRKLVNMAIARGHDGLIVRNVVDYGSYVDYPDPMDIYVTLKSQDQIKLTDNLTPTDSPDIRFKKTKITKPAEETTDKKTYDQTVEGFLGTTDYLTSEIEYMKEQRKVERAEDRKFATKQKNEAVARVQAEEREKREELAQKHREKLLAEQEAFKEKERVIKKEYADELAMTKQEFADVERALKSQFKQEAKNLKAFTPLAQKLTIAHIQANIHSEGIVSIPTDAENIAKNAERIMLVPFSQGGVIKDGKLQLKSFVPAIEALSDVYNQENFGALYNDGVAMAIGAMLDWEARGSASVEQEKQALALYKAIRKLGGGTARLIERQRIRSAAEANYGFETLGMYKAPNSFFLNAQKLVSMISDPRASIDMFVSELSLVGDKLINEGSKQAGFAKVYEFDSQKQIAQIQKELGLDKKKDTVSVGGEDLPFLGALEWRLMLSMPEYTKEFKDAHVGYSFVKGDHDTKIKYSDEVLADLVKAIPDDYLAKARKLIVDDFYGKFIYDKIAEVYNRATGLDYGELMPRGEYMRLSTQPLRSSLLTPKVTNVASTSNLKARNKGVGAIEMKGGLFNKMQEVAEMTAYEAYLKPLASEVDHILNTIDNDGKTLITKLGITKEQFLKWYIDEITGAIKPESTGGFGQAMTTFILSNWKIAPTQVLSAFTSGLSPTEQFHPYLMKQALKPNDKHQHALDNLFTLVPEAKNRGESNDVYFGNVGNVKDTKFSRIMAAIGKFVAKVTGTNFSDKATVRYILLSALSSEAKKMGLPIDDMSVAKAAEQRARTLYMTQISNNAKHFSPAQFVSNPYKGGKTTGTSATLMRMVKAFGGASKAFTNFFNRGVLRLARMKKLGKFVKAHTLAEYDTAIKNSEADMKKYSELLSKAEADLEIAKKNRVEKRDARKKRKKGNGYTPKTQKAYEQAKAIENELKGLVKELSASLRKAENSYEEAHGKKAFYEKSKTSYEEWAAKKQGAKLVTNMLAGLVLAGLGKSAIDIIYDLLFRKREPEELVEQWQNGSLEMEMIRNSTVNLYPALRTVSSVIFQGYDATDPTYEMISLLTDTAHAVKSFAENPTEANRKAMLRDGFKAGSIISGVPAKTIYDQTTGLLSWFNPEAALGMKDIFYQVNSTATGKFHEYLGKGDERQASAYLSKILTERVGEVSESVKSEILSLAKNDDNAIPGSIPSKYTKDDGTEITLSWTQQQEAKRFYSRANAQVGKLLTDNSYKKLDSASKASLIKSVYSYYRNAALSKVLGSDYAKTLNKYEMLAKTGDTKTGAIIAAVRYINTLQATKRLTRKEQAVKYVNRLSLTKGEKLIVLKMAGFGVDTKSLTSALRSKGLSKAEAEAFAS